LNHIAGVVNYSHNSLL